MNKRKIALLIALCSLIVLVFLTGAVAASRQEKHHEWYCGPGETCHIYAAEGSRIYYLCQKSPIGLQINGADSLQADCGVK